MCFATYANASEGKASEEDELFIGFFLGEENDTVVVLPGFVELMAWDRTRKVYNFWELLDPNWHFRGTSADVLANVADINLGVRNARFHLERPSPTDNRQPILRCSGCHTLGGPVMKELEAPN
ncbi:MAG: hypothetical protein WKF75_21015, partial [Singulisphaera sp.]